MKYIRKSTAIILILTILSAFSLCSVFADNTDTKSNIIYETSKTQILTSGATLETKVRFTVNGWQTINIIRVDLSNPNVAVNALTNPESVINLTTVKDLAQASGAIAAVNANFFVWDKDETKGRAVGPVIQSGQFVSDDTGINREADTFGTFSVDNLNRCFLDFWKVSIKLRAPNGNTVEVGRLNQPYHGHLDFSIIDSRMRKTTIGTTSGSADTVEMLVANGKVAEIRQKMPETQMPENGYIVVTRTEGSKFLFDNFKVGDDVSVSFSSTPDWTDKKFALSGGAMLLKDGTIPDEFSHISSLGEDPRTAIGSSKDGKLLFMVTVDGYSDKSIGMTQTELAQFMKEIGAYNALNFDGGGSTTMVARPEGSTSLDVINDPSDGSLRKISSAAGVFSLAPQSKLKGLIIDSADSNVFVNTSRAFTVKGYDSFYNPVAVDPASVKWSVSGITGTFEGNVFHPASIGTGKIKATVGDITQETTVYSLSAPVQLKLSSNNLSIASGETKTINVTGKNNGGYYAAIDSADVKWTASGDFGAFNKGVFFAKAVGSGYIGAHTGNVHAYCKVSVIQSGADTDNSAMSSVSIPKDTEPVDSANRYVPIKNGPDSFRFAVFGQSSEPDNSLEKLLLTKFTSKINSYLDFSVVVGKSKHAFTAGIKKPKLQTGSWYKSTDYKKSRFIQLDMSGGSLREATPAQWQWFFDQLKSAPGKNVFILLADSPQNFTDSLEADLFQNILSQYRQSTKKNVWVFYNGSKNTGYMEKGIKYISSAGFDIPGIKPGNTGAAQYALITVNSNSITYQFKPVSP